MANIKKTFYLPFIAVLLSNCFAWRALRLGIPDVHDGNKLPNVIIHNNAKNTVAFVKKIKPISSSIKFAIDTIETAAFLVIKNDTMVYEFYNQQTHWNENLNGFSMTKSVVSLLVFIAIKENKLHMKDLICNYVPNVCEVDSNFKYLTIADLMNMQSGISTKGENTYLKGTKYYYTKNNKKKIPNFYQKYSPKKFHYENANTQILHWILENVYHKKTYELLEEKIWKPLQMEFTANWQIDNKRDKDVKAYCCISACARDWAKLGYLYLNKGKYNTEQILPDSFFNFLDTLHKNPNEYANQIWLWDDNKNKIDSMEKMYSKINKMYRPSYSFQGLFQQFIYINPMKNLLIIRLGECCTNLVDEELIHLIENYYK